MKTSILIILSTLVLISCFPDMKKQYDVKMNSKNDSLSNAVQRLVIDSLDGVLSCTAVVYDSSGFEHRKYIELEIGVNYDIAASESDEEQFKLKLNTLMLNIFSKKEYMGMAMVKFKGPGQYSSKGFEIGWFDSE